ncbi:hypothetical protein MWH28_06760 [Natroniella sulfidigena]|uniref:hypothetical protein n=1 Tax=Natroniella sulfidigena TaxID=723921 RepID=UPI002009FEF9|nr:hypothetical protein [Natroniella sulfidigena]MCK8817073.1 hypothetical protein [Natroniella sulfidigena]
MNNYIIQLFLLLVVLNRIIFIYQIIGYYLIIQQKKTKEIEQRDQLRDRDIDKEDIKRSYINLFSAENWV